MTEETKDLLRQGIVPVLLGNHREAHRLSARLYRTYGVPSVLCGERRTLWDLLDPCCSFHALTREGDPRLTAEQLADLAAEYEDCFLVLVPFNDADQALIHGHGELIEPYFVCRDPEALWSDPMLETLRLI